MTKTCSSIKTPNSKSYTRESAHSKSTSTTYSSAPNSWLLNGPITIRSYRSSPKSSRKKERATLLINSRFIINPQNKKYQIKQSLKKLSLSTKVLRRGMSGLVRRKKKDLMQSQENLTEASTGGMTDWRIWNLPSTPYLSKVASKKIFHLIKSEEMFIATWRVKQMLAWGCQHLSTPCKTWRMSLERNRRSPKKTQYIR